MTGIVLETVGDHSTDPFVKQDNVVVCPICNGDGFLLSNGGCMICYLCNGGGFVNKTKEETK